MVGIGQPVPCVDGVDRDYVDLDAAASTAASAFVRTKVDTFLPWYSSVHRGAGYKSRVATAAYEDARAAVLRFAGRDPQGDDIAVFCRNTTEAINHLAYRLRLSPDDTVVTTVVEHHANLLPWARVARRRWVECDASGVFDTAAVAAALDAGPSPRLLAVTGASNVTGWLPPIDEIIDAAHDRGVPVLVDAAQLAPHRPLPSRADYLAWSGHKMYAPYGSGAPIGPRSTFSEGDPFLAGGGAVDLVDLDEVIWTDPPEREEAGSPNVVGAVAMHAAIDALGDVGWSAIAEHEAALAIRLREGLAAIDGVRVLGPGPATQGSGSGHETLAVAAFVVTGVHHALVAARLSAEHAIGVRHGCFCAHPYLIRLLGLTESEVHAYRDGVLRGDRSAIPGAVRASCGIATSDADVDALVAAVAAIASGEEPPVAYVQDRYTGDFWPEGAAPGWSEDDRAIGASCARN
ncbi:MAG: aminotransferase class V-fold PLP-dependent enzyme [Acidimicrobiales bacterium]|jgi:selenocysteine lyase/cysteine desulfurase|nr:aminotransferase class V-fold PLP-dependent enzyme [Acidimicrobiales bacterium]